MRAAVAIPVAIAVLSVTATLAVEGKREGQAVRAHTAVPGRQARAVHPGRVGRERRAVPNADPRMLGPHRGRQPQPDVPLRCRIRPRADDLPGGASRLRRGRLRPGVEVGPLRLVDVGAEAHPVPTRVRRRRSPLGVALEHRRQVLDRAPDHRPRGGVRQIGIELGLLGLRPPLRLVEEAVVADAIAAQVDRVSGPARRARRVGRLAVPRVAREHRADGPPRGVPLVRDPLVGGIVVGPPLRLVDGPLPDDLLPLHVHTPAAPDGVRARLRVVSGPPIGLASAPRVAGSGPGATRRAVRESVRVNCERRPAPPRCTSAAPASRHGPAGRTARRGSPTRRRPGRDRPRRRSPRGRPRPGARRPRPGRRCDRSSA